MPSKTQPRPTKSLSSRFALGQEAHRGWKILWLAGKNFFKIDGTQWAAAFAFNALSSLFPLLVLAVTIASFFVDRDVAGKVIISHLETYVPITGEMQRHIFDTIAGVIKARHQAGAVAFLVLLWSAHQCFTTLICATNLAWGVPPCNWWRLPLKSLAVLGSTAGAVLLGMAVPVVMKIVERWFSPAHLLHSWVNSLADFLIPSVVAFLSLSLFYRLAPCRRTRFGEVWVAALWATILLRASESLFLLYLECFATSNAVYGAFGGVLALLFWIYVSGCVFIFGACLCAGHAQLPSPQDIQKPPGGHKRAKSAL